MRTEPQVSPGNIGLVRRCGDVLTVVFAIGNVCDTAQRCDFDAVQPKCQSHVQRALAVHGYVFDMAQHMLVVALVANGYDEPRPNVQRNAYPPKVDVWTDARDGAYRWYKIENLWRKVATKTDKHTQMINGSANGRAMGGRKCRNMYANSERHPNGGATAVA